MSERKPLDAREGARLSAWFDGELGEVEAAEARARLREDPAARAQLQEWRTLREELQSLQPETLSLERMDAMRLRLAAREARDAVGLARAVRLWSLAAVFLLVLGIGWSLGERWLGPGAGAPAYASEPRDFERALEELLDPQPAAEAGGAAQRPLQRKLRRLPAPASPTVAPVQEPAPTE